MYNTFLFLQSKIDLHIEYNPFYKGIHIIPVKLVNLFVVV